MEEGDWCINAFTMETWLQIPRNSPGFPSEGDPDPLRSHCPSQPALSFTGSVTRPPQTLARAKGFRYNWQNGAFGWRKTEQTNHREIPSLSDLGPGPSLQRRVRSS